MIKIIYECLLLLKITPNFGVPQWEVFDVSELPTDFFLNFSQEMIDKILEQDRVRFTMTFKSGQDIDKILNVDKVGDAILVVNGQINCEFDEDSKRIQFYDPILTKMVRFIKL